MHIRRLAQTGGFAAVLLSVAFLAHAAGEYESVWRTDFRAAQAEAKRLRRPMVIHFSAEWCGPCRQMERDVLKSRDLLERLGKNFVAVKIDSDARPDLVRQYNIRALPSDIFVDPNGRILSQTQGYQEKSRYLAQIAHVEARWAQAQTMHIARDSRPQSTTERRDESPLARQDSSASSKQQQQQQQNEGRPEAPALGNPQVIIGLDGFSPVTLARERKWVKGRKEFTATYQDVVYYMSSAEELQAFQSHPGKFAPRLLGCDPVVLWKSDRAVSGSTQFGAFFDGELYLFVSDESREQFKRSPIRYTRARHVLHVDDINPTRLR